MHNAISSKQCPKCKETKDISLFGKNKSTSSGVSSYCKECIRKVSSDFYKSNPDKCREASKDWIRRNKEKYSAKRKEWSINNKDKKKETQRRWYVRHQESLGKKVRDRPRKNKEASLLTVTSVELVSIELVARRERKKKHSQKRRDLIKRNGGKRSKIIKDKLLVLQVGRCAVCACNLHDVRVHIDHILPITHGGTDDDWNLQLLCERCNKSKGSRDPIEFMQSRGLLL